MFSQFDERPLAKKAKSILYVGGFVLPDGNAAAQRVMANAKLFSSIGYDVVFINYSKDVSEPRKTTYCGFECFEFPKTERSLFSGFDVDCIENILEARQDIGLVVAYNYLAPSLARLIKVCHRKKVLCIGDVTEWYRARDAAFPKSLLKYFDTTIRMRVLQPRMDGLIVISSYLKRYYGARVPTVLLPPLVDMSEEKWMPPAPFFHDGIRLVYAGRPSKTKERLDLIAKAVVSLPDTMRIQLDIVGVTSNEFTQIYGYSVEHDRVVFHGRVSHEKALAYVKQADYSVIVRDDNRVTRAGFPTKFVESISCGTPVICNDHSDLKAWIERGECGFIVAEESLAGDIRHVLYEKTLSFKKEMFDFHRYIPQTKKFLEQVEERKK